jgi:hypothetical protein
MTGTKTFRTVVVLTVATGIGMAERMTFSDVHELIGWLAGGPVWTHQLPALREPSEQAAQAALGAAWEPFDPAREDCLAYAARMVGRLGETLEVAPAAKPFHRADAVIADAVEAMGGDASRVTVVRTDG